MMAVFQTAKEKVFRTASVGGLVAIWLLQSALFPNLTQGQQLDIGSLSNEAVISEADAGVFVAAFRVVLTPASSEVVTVTVSTVDGSATAGADYQAIAPTILTFNPGVTLHTIVVPILDDALDEPTETYTVQLTNPVNAPLGTSQTIGTVLDDDPAPSLSIGDASLRENEAGTVEITLSNPSGQTVTVDWATEDGSATAPDDYTTSSGTMTFPSGATSRLLNLTVVDDSLDEPPENFFINLSSAVGASIADAQGEVTILDEDPNSELAVIDAMVVEGGLATIEVTLTPASGRLVEVDFVTADDSATGHVDYEDGAGHLTFPPGTTSAELTLQTIEDEAIEGDETFFVRLANPLRANIADGEGVVTIQDNEILPELSIADTNVDEGATANLTLTLSSAQLTPVTVQIETQEGTASAGDDYVGGSALLTFSPGTDSLSVAYSTLQDQMIEGDETFFAVLSAATGAVIGDGVATVTIDDDEVSEPSLTIDDARTFEGEGPFDIVLRLSGPAATVVSVDLSSADGTGIAGEDYVQVLVTPVFFSIGQTELAVRLDTLNDDQLEGDENFFIDLSNVSGATLDDSRGDVTIFDDEALFFRDGFESGDMSRWSQSP